MNARVERLVEDYNEVREALARARVEQARTREQVLDARRLRVARRQLGERLWTIYTGGAPSTLGQLLGADSIHQALVTTKYQEVVGADRAAVDRVEQLRRQVEALAAKLADQAERQELLQARLAAARPVDRLGRSEGVVLVRLRGSRSPGSNAPHFVYEHVAGRFRSAPPARRAVRAQRAGRSGRHDKRLARARPCPRP